MSRLPMSELILTDPTHEQLLQTPIGEWYRVFNAEDFFAYLHIRGKHCLIALEARPHYCDRGSWLAKLQVLNPIELTIDYVDGWNPGRYYFDKERAVLECEAWLRARKQVEEGDRPFPPLQTVEFDIATVETEYPR